MEEYKYTTVHDFKTHFSRYAREVEQGRYRAVVVKRGRHPVGMFISLKKTQADGSGKTP